MIRRGVAKSQAADRSASEPGVSHDGVASSSSVPPQLVWQQSLYGTGRVQAVRRELKPDLWKIAYKGVRRLASQSGGRRLASQSGGVCVCVCVCVWV